MVRGRWKVLHTCKKWSRIYFKFSKGEICRVKKINIWWSSIWWS